MYKRQIYQIAESNEKNQFVSENRIESKLFLPELECSTSHCIRLQAYKHFMGNSVNPNCPRCGHAMQMLEQWFNYPGTLQYNWKFLAPVKHFLYLHYQRLRANRSHWQDVFCDGLVRTPSTTATARTSPELLRH